jgi:phospholipase/carboxylesterase
VSVPRPLTIVALHGVARNGDEIGRLSACVPERMRLASPDVRWVFPRAEERPLSLFGGRPAVAWYDILASDRSRLDDAGIERASRQVRDVIRAERALGPADRALVLVGYSQGGSLALHVGLRLGDEVQGVAAIAGALPYPDDIPEAAAGAPRVFLGHGRFDRRVPYALGLETAELLRARGYETEWRSYWCGHVLLARALGDVRRWLAGDDAAAEPAQDGLAAA